MRELEGVKRHLDGETEDLQNQVWWRYCVACRRTYLPGTSLFLQEIAQDLHGIAHELHKMFFTLHSINSTRYACTLDPNETRLKHIGKQLFRRGRRHLWPVRSSALSVRRCARRALSMQCTGMSSYFVSCGTSNIMNIVCNPREFHAEIYSVHYLYFMHHVHPLCAAAWRVSCAQLHHRDTEKLGSSLAYSVDEILHFSCRRLLCLRASSPHHNFRFSRENTQRSRQLLSSLKYCNKRDATVQLVRWRC